MNKTQAVDRAGEIYGILYWHERGTFPIDTQEAGLLKAEMDLINSRLDKNEYPLETNERGNTIERSSNHNADRYLYDFKLCTPDQGWEQWDTDQDAWYFGVWVNQKDRKILTYAEGDVTVVTCPDADHFKAEIESMEAFYGKPPIVALAADGIDNSLKLINPVGFISDRLTSNEL